MFVIEQKAKWAAENDLVADKQNVQARENRHKAIARKHLK